MRRLTALLLAAVLPAALLTTSATALPVSEGGVRDLGDRLELTVPAGHGGPGYTVEVTKAPFQITTKRGGGIVLQTAAATSASTGPAVFRTQAGSASATSVQSASWHDGVLDLTVATTIAGDTVSY